MDDKKSKKKVSKDDEIDKFFTMSCKKEKIILTGDPEEDMKKIQTINSSDKKNRLNIMDKKDYSLISFITSTKRPDLYHRYCYTSGEDYIIKQLKKKENNIENNKENIENNKENNIENNKENLEDNKENNNENNKENANENNIEKNSESGSNSSLENYQMKGQLMRYFTFNTNITYKCFNCGEVGHMAGNCPYENKIICLKCNRKGHEDRDCPYTKCFKCNKFGHKNFQCPIKIDKLKVCNRCLGIGHKDENCLREPFYPYNNFYHNNKYYCQYCGSNKHLICPFKNNFNFNLDFEDEYLNDISKDEVENWENMRKKLNKEEKKQEFKEDNKEEIKEESEEGEIIEDGNNYFSDMDNREIYKSIFCPICAGRHYFEKCEEYILNKEKYKNKFDEQREIFVKNVINRNNRNKDYKDYNNRKFEKNRSRDKEYNNNNKKFREKNYDDYNNRNNFEHRFNNKGKKYRNDNNSKYSKGNYNN